ncbi:diadenylate cyclase [Mycoplasma enhydrae]|uniref:diadenylate cyclase n=1 Tax=Mycoplasma enhydrae TaxID=2499220 RepID=UPI00197BC6DB|nr:diadenylate cyclase [Mycoplasma enhydrae]MBN4089236.1 diadenylate cyclase [Mycoplasma enhydrae]MCV3733604.1 diadenylate cyclase [Mycoplasma enhydrae]MCV3753419.1 diadenylate cyclase [Mycoplasma enhydrae]
MEKNILYAILSLVILVTIVIVTNYAIALFNAIKRNKSNKKALGDSTRIRIIFQLKEAIEYLSKTKTGALITIENNDNLDSLRTDGVILDANISAALLISIFNKNSPLHDGAVVIRNNKIHYAATYYKITKKSINNKYGARHRAGMGISETSDAITIIVSEENGGVTVAKTGEFKQVPIDALQDTLGRIIKDDKKF